MRLLILLAGLLVIAGFAIAAPAYSSDFEAFATSDCGSVLSPDLQTAGDVSPCNDALLVPRAVAGALAGLAAVAAFLGMRHSRSIGRLHNRERDQCLVVGAVAVFLLAWIVLAFLTMQFMTYPAGD